MGKIDDVRIYSRALSGPEIQAIYSTSGGFPTLPGMTSPARDLDGDGLADDVNGNGRLDFADIVVFFENIDSPEVQDNASAFDFNGNGAADLADVTALFDLVTA